jgi:multiple sugar transport system permease protein
MIAHAPTSSARWLRNLALPLAGLLIAASSLGPFLWQMSTAFQPDRALMATPPQLWPSPVTLEHFYNVFVVKQFHYYIVNSVIVAGATTLLCLIFGLLGAYGLARFDVRGRFGILGVILSISMFPQIAIVAPLYLIMSTWRWGCRSSSGYCSAICTRCRASSTRRPRSTARGRCASCS